MTHKHKYISTCTAKILETTNKGYKILTINTKGLTKTERSGKIQYFDKWLWEYNFEPI